MKFGKTWADVMWQPACKPSHSNCSNSYNPKNSNSLYEKTKAQVYATGNKWAIENFNETHN